MVHASTFATLFAVTLVVAAGPARAQHASPGAMGHDMIDLKQAQAKAVVLPASGVGTAPLDVKSGRPIVEVMINGKGPYKFFVDTGASHTVIDRSITEALGLPKVGQATMGDPANPHAIQVDRVRIDKLQVGDAEFDGLEAASWDEAAGLGASTDHPLGVIGFPVWHDVLLTLDYVDGTLSVRRGKVAASAHAVPFTMDEGIVLLPVKVGGHEYHAHLDTGNSAFCSIPAAETTQVHFTGPLQEVGIARTVNSTFTISGGVLDGSFQVADQAYDRPFLTVQGVLPRVNVGGRLLQDYALTFDQKSLLVDFARKQVTPPPTQPAGGGGKGAGVGVSPQGDGSLLVAIILPGSPVSTKDVKVGDRIVKLDGQETKGLTDDQRRALMHKSPLTLTLVRDGKPFDTTVEF